MCTVFLNTIIYHGRISYYYVRVYVTVFIVQYICVMIMFIVLGDVLDDHHHIISVSRAITYSQPDCQLRELSDWLDVSFFVCNLVRAPTVVCMLAVWLIGNLLLVG